MGLILSQQKSDIDIIKEIIITQKEMKPLSVSKLQDIKSKLEKLTNSEHITLINACIKIYGNVITELTKYPNKNCTIPPSQEEVDDLVLIEQINLLPKPPSNMKYIKLHGGGKYNFKRLKNLTKL